MAYDQGLANRIRSVLSDEHGLTERKMFGGLGFMLDGNMVAAAGSGGALMLRVAPDTGRELLDGERITPMEMNGRSMNGWLLVQPDAVETDEELAAIVQYGIDHVRTLPPK